MASIALQAEQKRYSKSLKEFLSSENQWKIVAYTMECYYWPAVSLRK